MSRIVIVGAGVGGATCAALLARAGHEVTVLEAQAYPGGCAGTFLHRGYRFDAGATLAGGFFPGGPHQVVGERLGIRWPVHALDPAWQVHLPDRTVTRHGEPARWEAELARAFADDPHLARTLAFFRDVASASERTWSFALRRPPWPPSRPSDLLDLARALSPDVFPALPLALETTAAFLARRGVDSPAVRRFVDGQLLISAQTTAARANALFGATALDLPRTGVHHVDGGIGRITELLLDSVKASGGEVRRKRRVDHIEVRGGRFAAAITTRGERFEGDACVANLTPGDLAQLLGDAAPGRLRTELDRRPEPWGAFTLYLGVEDRGLPQIDHHQVLAEGELGEGNSVFVSISRSGDELRAPPGQRAVTISTHTRTEPWWRLRETPGAQAAYDERVALYRERLLDGAARAIPGLRGRIRLELPGTPVTFRYYTGRRRGGVGGFPFESVLAARGPRTGVGGLWLVGDSVFPGQSTAAVTLGALRVAEEASRGLA